MVFVFGSPVTVPPDADRDAMEEIRARLEVSMREITEKADAYWEGHSQR